VKRPKNGEFRGVNRVEWPVESGELVTSHSPLPTSHSYHYLRLMRSRLYELLAEHLTEHKRNLFEQILAQRTRHVTLVMEDLYQAQNTSAIQRSAESFGVQDLHIIENKHTFSHHRRISKGSSDWLTMHRYNDAGSNNSQQCLHSLKERGYQLVVTALHEKTIALHEVDLSKKTAVLVGTELTGASEVAMQMADVYMKIPTVGFTESLNVSVASAIIMQHLTHRMRIENRAWQLSEEEQLNLKIEWAKRSIYWSKYIVEMWESGEV
jgi:tRNA (guanosine-2'-O-)-methyltransferase